ncbi:MAG: hypothetical protein LBK06_08945 [Planctomycetaceae bacterium]|jgi:hypothetical protein|nr:hypothetical protein [Planctomycetaceae bacterium]
MSVKILIWFPFILKWSKGLNKAIFAKAVLKFAKLNTVAQQREAVVQGRSLLPYRLRYQMVNFSLTIAADSFCHFA